MEVHTDSINNCLAPAKLNLFLHITGQRADGYHLLQTVFQLVNWGDILHFTLRKDAQIVRQKALKNIAKEHDLSLRAAHLLREYVQQPNLGVNIEIEKNIPLGAGLGGGSSDAATTLLALNQLWQLHLPRDVLQALALKLGADVPFFIFGQNAFAEGIGETLQAVQLPHRYFLIVRPKAHISTEKIFSDKCLTRSSKKIKIHDFLASQNLSDRWPDDFGTNDMQNVVEKSCTEVAEVLNWFKAHAPARMTGSGSCIFSAFSSKEQCHHVQSKLPKHWKSYAVESLNQHPLYTFAK